MTTYRRLTKALAHSPSGFRRCHSMNDDENFARFRRFVDRIGKQYRKDMAGLRLRTRMKKRRAAAASPA